MTLRVMLLGAAPDTYNLGVSALVTSFVAAVDEADTSVEIDVIDNGHGRRRGHLSIGDELRPVTFIGAKATKQLARRDSLYRVYLAGRAGRTTSYLIDDLRRCDVALDVSGGDSFSDIYGRQRFLQVLLQKHLVLTQDRPLVLLPQTIGPFVSTSARRLAVGVLERADVVIARDEWSHGQLRSLLGEKFDAQRHKLGPDLAFALPPGDPQIDRRTREFLDSGRLTVGLNISGLLYLDEKSTRRFGFADDYRRVTQVVIEAFLRNTDAQILLVSHVVAPPGRPESDIEAHRRIASVVDDVRRIHIAPPPSTPSAAKGLIAQTDWFAGSRMHSTIAALSSGVPAASLAYSDKAAGVFGTVGCEHDIADLRELRAGQAADALLRSFHRRDMTRNRLAERLPEVRDRARQQVIEAIELSRQQQTTRKGSA